MLNLFAPSGLCASHLHFWSLCSLGFCVLRSHPARFACNLRFPLTFFFSKKCVSFNSKCYETQRNGKKKKRNVTHMMCNLIVARHSFLCLCVCIEIWLTPLKFPNFGSHWEQDHVPIALNWWRLIQWLSYYVIFEFLNGGPF